MRSWQDWWPTVRQIWFLDAPRRCKAFVLRAGEKLRAFLELEMSRRHVSQKVAHNHVQRIGQINANDLDAIAFIPQ